MIPVLGIPILNRPDLLAEMFATIDTDIQRRIIIDNGGVVPPDFPASVARLPSNLGVAASWNLILKLTPRAPWWLIANFDLRFAPGDLERFADAMSTQEPRVVWANETGMACFALNRGALQKTGYFDENYHPAYCEDNDYAHRLKLAGVEVVVLSTGIVHQISATIRSDEKYRTHNQRTFPSNVAYHRAKWGGSMGEERFTSPFDSGGDIRVNPIDPERLRALSWE